MASSQPKTITLTFTVDNGANEVDLYEALGLTGEWPGIVTGVRLECPVNRTPFAYNNFTIDCSTDGYVDEVAATRPAA